MLKKYILIVALGLNSIFVNAQFKIENDTLYCSGAAGTSSTSFIEIYGETHIIHLGTASEIIKWVRTTKELPDPTWTSAVCDIVSCKPPEVDTGSFMIEAGDTGYMSFHFYASNISGNGKMIVKFYRASNPLEYVDIVTFGRLWNPTSLTSPTQVVTRAIPNPTQNSLTLNNSLIEEGKLVILNSIGQIISILDYKNNMTVDMMDFPAGIYSFRILDSSNTLDCKVIKE